MYCSNILLSHGYEVKQLIGKGGFSEVYLVRSIKFDEMFAAKIITIDEKSKNHVSELEKEANLLRRVTHPNIINLYDVFTDSGYFIIVTEYCPNGSVNDYIQKHGRVTGPVFNSLAIQIIQALIYLHSLGIAHLDIKPQNILIGRYGRLKLTDFGTANIFKEKKVNEKFQCSKAYAPPEVFKKVSHDPFKRDIWSLGVTLFYINTLEYPFNVESDDALMRSVCMGIFCISDEMEPTVKSFVYKCFIVEPKDRISLEKGLEIFSELSNNPQEPQTNYLRKFNSVTCDSSSTQSEKSQILLSKQGKLVQGASYQYLAKLPNLEPSPLSDSTDQNSPTSNQKLKVFKGVGSIVIKNANRSRIGRRKDSFSIMNLPSLGL